MAKKIITAVTGLALAAGITVTSTTTAAAADYTVKEGDSLWKISKEQLGKGTRYREIFEANKDTIKDPRVIRVGQTLNIPGKNVVADSGIKDTSESPAEIAQGTKKIDAAEGAEISNDASIEETVKNADASSAITPYSSFAGKWVGVGYYVDGLPGYEIDMPEYKGDLQKMPSKMEIAEDGTFFITQLLDIAGQFTKDGEGFVYTSPKGLYDIKIKYDSYSDAIYLSGSIRDSKTDIIFMREPDVPDIASKLIGKWVCVDGFNYQHDPSITQDYHIELHNLTNVQIEFLPEFRAKVTYNPDIVFETNYIVEGNYIRIPFVKDQEIRLYVALNPQGELTGLRLTSHFDSKGNVDGAIFHRVAETPTGSLEDIIIGEWEDTYCFDGLHVVNSKTIDKYVIDKFQVSMDDFVGTTVFCADGTGYQVRRSGGTDSFVYRINDDTITCVFDNGSTGTLVYSKDTGCLYAYDSGYDFPRTYVIEKVS